MFILKPITTYYLEFIAKTCEYSTSLKLNIALFFLPTTNTI